MIVIKNNYDEPRKVVCPYCKSILGVIPSDIRYDTDGDEYCKCPLCEHSLGIDRKSLFSKEFAKNMEE